MSEETKFIVEVILAMLMFIIALSLSVYLFIKIKKNKQIIKLKVSKKQSIFLIVLIILLIIFNIILFGKMIYENSSIGKSEMPTYEITYHNSPFEGYLGKHVSGNNVRGLLVQIKSNNRLAKSKNESIGNYIFVKINDEEVSEFEEIVDDFSSIKKSSTYTVTYGGDNSVNDSTEAIGTYWTNGHIKYIIIKENVDTLETNEINYSEERNE